MDKDELLTLLDLSGKEPEKPSQTGPIIFQNHDPPANQHAGPTALELDEWALRRGKEIREESERVRKLDLDDHAVADFFGAAFEPDPQLTPACRDSSRHAFVQQLLQTPEYRSLHAATMLQDAAASIAAVAFAEQYAESRKEEETGGDEGGKGAMDREMATIRAIGKALSKASEEVEEAREAAAAMGFGPGSPGSNDPKAIVELYRRIRSNPSLRRICELAGRYRRVAQSRQRRKLTHGMDDMFGVTLGGEIDRALPHELAKLAIPECEDDVLRRLVERQVMCREYRASEPVGKGPIIVSVDESGSMEGDKVHTAKALALAMAWIAPATASLDRPGRVLRRFRRATVGFAAGPMERGPPDGMAFGVHRLRFVAGRAHSRAATLLRRAEGTGRHHGCRPHHRCGLPNPR
jgi:hypothetical protein